MRHASLRDSRLAVIQRLKRGGAMTVKRLAADVGVTTVAVRQHLAILRELGLVCRNMPGAVDETGRPAPRDPRRRDARERGPARGPDVREESRPGRKPGRPSATWSLTDQAAELFPDRHGALTVDLIGAMRSTLGDDALMRIVEVRARDQVNLYRERLPAGGSLKKRVEALATQRSDEGYMAEVVQERPGSYLLIEHHCPICDAARSCQGLCAAELDVFRSILGAHVTVERIEHVLAAGARCVYRIEAV